MLNCPSSAMVSLLAYNRCDSSSIPVIGSGFTCTGEGIEVARSSFLRVIRLPPYFFLQWIDCKTSLEPDTWTQSIVFFLYSGMVGVTYTFCDAFVRWQARIFTSGGEILPPSDNKLMFWTYSFLIFSKGLETSSSNLLDLLLKYNNTCHAYKFRTRENIL